MKDACEDCDVKPDIPEDDLVECHGCGKTICVNECVFDSEIVNGVHEMYWCGDCEYMPPNGEQMTCPICDKRPVRTSLGLCAWCDNTQGEDPSELLEFLAQKQKEIATSKKKESE